MIRPERAPLGRALAEDPQNAEVQIAVERLARALDKLERLRDEPSREDMAEALLREIGGDAFEVHSAGTHPKGLNERSLRTLAEAGIDASRARSKSVDEFRGQPFDYVITVCDQAREVCPYFPGGGESLHWGYEDPADATGTAVSNSPAAIRVVAAVSCRTGPTIAFDRLTSTAMPPAISPIASARVTKNQRRAMRDAASALRRIAS